MTLASVSCKTSVDVQAQNMQESLGVAKHLCDEQAKLTQEQCLNSKPVLMRLAVGDDKLALLVAAFVNVYEAAQNCRKRSKQIEAFCRKLPEKLNTSIQFLPENCGGSAEGIRKDFEQHKRELMEKNLLYQRKIAEALKRINNQQNSIERTIRSNWKMFGSIQ